MSIRDGSTRRRWRARLALPESFGKEKINIDAGIPALQVPAASLIKPKKRTGVLVRPGMEPFGVRVRW